MLSEHLCGSKLLKPSLHTCSSYRVTCEENSIPWPVKSSQTERLSTLQRDWRFLFVYKIYVSLFIYTQNYLDADGVPIPTERSSMMCNSCSLATFLSLSAFLITLYSSTVLILLPFRAHLLVDVGAQDYGHRNNFTHMHTNTEMQSSLGWNEPAIWEHSAKLRRCLELQVGQNFGFTFHPKDHWYHVS